MSNDLLILSVLLVGALVGFIGGWWRYDTVALATLLLATLSGVVPAEDAFSGFGHPAVVTVAAVLVISRALFQAGVVDALSGVLLRVGPRPTMQVLGLTLGVAVLSAFINNVGALALMLPVGLTMSRIHGLPPSKLLMPLAFGSLLGGLCTLIGTPPNVIVASFWGRVSGEPFAFFDFARVGLPVAVVGVLYIGLVGWRVLPNRKGQTSPEDRFQVAAYLGELRVVESSRAEGLTLRELREELDDVLPVLGVVRGDRHLAAYRFQGLLKVGDVLLVEGETKDIEKLAHGAGLKIGLDDDEDEAEQDSAGNEDAKAPPAGAAGPAGPAVTEKEKTDAAQKEEEKDEEKVPDGDLELGEAIVMGQSRLVGRNVREAGLSALSDLTLVAVSRQGRRLRGRLRDVRFQLGDILLLQGPESVLAEQMSEWGCLPLADRELRLGKPRRLVKALLIFAAAIAGISSGWVTAAVGLMAAAVLMVVTGVVSLRRAYEGIDWPVLVLLGAMIPVGKAFETTGGARWLAGQLVALDFAHAPMLGLALLLVLTMCLSDVINNAAAAVLMAPIALSLANGLEVNQSPFLMAVAIGASCAFLTPIGHQSNTLVFGPGGYRFGDYWKLGLPLQIVMLAVALPMLAWAWPLR